MSDEERPHLPSGPAAADRLRSAIDSGRTGDKVAAADPAMAPLGTDDEAAGHPVTAARAAIAAEHETARVAPNRADGARKNRLVALALPALVAVMAVTFVVAALLSG